MPNIQILDQNTINQIAAVEVIERPASVVKELLENAIDAKATAITVEIKEGGISFIRITDNGCGIAKEEIPLAFLRHSTSKIRSVEDLMTATSLGFRGEALSSIAAVSQVELITKVSSSLNGCRYCIEGGMEKIFEEIGCPEGTTFLVRNLFYNTPARRKFLKSAQTEAGYISDIVEKIALSHPEISIRFIHNNQNKLHTSGNCNLKDIVYRIYGRDIATNLLSVQASMESISVYGFIGKPLISRGNRAYENYYINGRYIRSSMISKVIEDAYQSFLMQHKYPFTVLHIQIDSNLLDINVHPTKMDLRIKDAENLIPFLYHTLYNILSSKELIPEVSAFERSKEYEKVKKREKRLAEPFEKNRIAKEQQIKEQALYQINQKPFIEQAEQIELFNGQFLAKEAKEQHRIIGQVFETYWLVEYQNKLFIIDQHAAHEKVLYEKMMTRLQTQQLISQMLNPPVILTLSIREEEIFIRFQSYFEKIGFVIEHFGGKEYAIRAVPDSLLGITQKELFLELLDNLAEEVQTQTITSSILNEKIASMSCKAAVKGNYTLSKLEVEALIEELMKLENPYHCPHGRPTIVVMSKYEMEKKFKRVL